LYLRSGKTLVHYGALAVVEEFFSEY